MIQASRRRGTLGLAAVFVLAAHVLSLAQSNAPAERFTGNAINISNVGRPGATPLDIVVERWSSEAERERLTSTLLDKGPQAFLDALQSTKRVGYMRTPTSLGYDLHFAWQEPTEEGGRRVILATDRPIGFWEAVNQPRTINYPFTVIEIHLNRAGEGEGKISVATRITGDKRRKTIELENYASQPVMLKEVKSSKVQG